MRLPCFPSLSMVLALVLVTPLRAQESVTFPSLDDTHTEIHALLFRPAGDGPFPAIVGLHGCGGLFNRKGRLVARETAWAATLTARGYIVLYPDSFGSRGLGHACADGGPHARPRAERSADAYGALLYLQKQPFVRGDYIGLLGWSHGGGTAMFTIAAGATMRPADLPRGDFRAAVAFYPGWCSAKAMGPDWTTAVPFLLEIGSDDDWTMAPPCVQLVETARQQGAPVSLQVYQDAYHDFDWPGMALHSWQPRPGKTVHTGMAPEARADALERVPAFFDRYLKE